MEENKRQVVNHIVNRTTPPKRPVRGCFFTLVLMVLMLVCAVSVTATVWLVMIPGEVTDLFGSPDPALSFTNRIVLTTELYIQKDSLLQPVDPNGAEQPFVVNSGDSVDTVALGLGDRGLIRNPEAFRNYLIYAGLDRGIQAGTYSFSPALNAVQIAQALQDATPKEVTFVILAGWRIEEIADVLPTSGLNITPDEFLALARNPMGVNLPYDFPAGNTLEGYLMPGEYSVPREINATDLINLFLARFNETVTQEMRDGFARQGLSVHQAVTLASLAQREAIVESEMPMITSVFLNRWNDGSKLDSDASVQYAVGSAERSWWPNPLTMDDLAADSPYNTYVYSGLPPAPIDNPSANALWSVARPAETPYYYFRAKCDGSGLHNFAVTFEEHVLNACP